MCEELVVFFFKVSKRGFKETSNVEQEYLNGYDHLEESVLYGKILWR